MKFLRLLVPAAILAAAMSCGNNPKSNNETEAPAESVEAVETAENTPKVYSAAFDGYTNIRETASSKAAVLGKFRNGPEGAVILEQEGDWTKVEYQGISGYVYSKYLTDEPTKEVLVDVDGDWLQGIWCNNWNAYLLVFNNGQYACYSDDFNEGDWLGYGVYHLEGTDIILSRTLDFVEITDEGEPVRHKEGEMTERYKILPSAGKIGEWVRFKYTSEQEYNSVVEEGFSCDVFVMTKAQFKKKKQEVAARLR